MKITTKIKTFEDACKAQGISAELPLFPHLEEAEQKAMQAHYQLCIINKALNEGWKADYSDDNEYKYYPCLWFDKSFGSSGAFVFGDCNHGYSYSAVGSRLVFKSKDLAKYAATQFIDLYRDYFTYYK
jgi:hypothetical protein